MITITCVIHSECFKMISLSISAISAIEVFYQMYSFLSSGTVALEAAVLICVRLLGNYPRGAP